MSRRRKKCLFQFFFYSRNRGRILTVRSRRRTGRRAILTVCVNGCFALLASLLVAVTLVPMLAHSLFKTNVKVKEEKPSKLAHGYKRILNWTLNHKLISFGLAVLLLVGSLFLVPSIGVSFYHPIKKNADAYVYTESRTVSKRRGKSSESRRSVLDEARWCQNGSVFVR